MEQTASGFSTAVSRVDDLNSAVDGLNNKIDSYMTFDADGLTLGKSDSSYSVNVSNEALTFRDSGAEVAKVTGQELQITNASIEHELRVGNYRMYQLNDQSMAFYWQS